MDDYVRNSLPDEVVILINNPPLDLPDIQNLRLSDENSKAASYNNDPDGLVAADFEDNSLPKMIPGAIPIYGRLSTKIAALVNDKPERTLIKMRPVRSDELDVPQSEAELMNMEPTDVVVIQNHLVVLLHSRACQHLEMGPYGDYYKNCNYPNCRVIKLLMKHMIRCQNNPACRFPYCEKSWEILRHYRWCMLPGCPICKPFKQQAFTCCHAKPFYEDGSLKRLEKTTDQKLGYE